MKKIKLICTHIFVVIFLVSITLLSCYNKNNSKKQTANIDLVEVENTNDNRSFDIQQIDSIRYVALKERINIPNINVEKLTDLENVKDILKGRVVWGEYDDETQKMIEHEQGEAVYKIIFRNGKTLSYDYEIFFIAYFPQEDILILEGEHYSQIMFNLTTGEEMEDVGNPDFILYSPSKQHRLNMYDNGQISIYFIQEKSDTQYRTTIQLCWDLKEIIGFCPNYIVDAFWQSDTILNFVAIDDNSEQKGEKLYYQLTITQ